MQTYLKRFYVTGVAVSSGQFGLTQPGDQISLNVSQLQVLYDNITASYLTDMNITVIDGIAIIDGYSLCYTEIRDAVSSILPVEPICEQCGRQNQQFFIYISLIYCMII